MAWRLGVTHPFAASLLFLSALLAALVATIPALDRWSDRSTWVLVVGFAAYAACAYGVARWPPSPPDLRLLRAIRRKVGRLLRARAEVAPLEVRPELEQLAGSARERIQDEISPAFRALLERTSQLGAEIATYGRTRHAPDPELQEGLRAIQAYYDEAKAACIRRAVNGEAKLVAMLEERDWTVLVQRVRHWVDDDIGGLQRALDEALAGPPVGVDQSAATEAGKGSVLKGRTPEHRSRASEALPEDLVEILEGALRSLNKLGTLAQTELAERLPRSLAARRSLSKGQALNELLVEGIKRLKVDDPETDAQAAEYEILWREYVREMTTVAIMIHLSISESTFYRWRHDAVLALAQDLWQQEQRVTGRYDPVAMDYLG